MRIARSTRRIGLRVTIAAATAAVTACLVFAGAQPAFAITGAPVDGSGSASMENILDQWTSGMAQFGVEVNYIGDGTGAGRVNFSEGNSDFAAMELPYGLPDSGGVTDPPPTRPFAYLPISAGALAFPYHLVVNGHLVTNLRLSGLTLAKIFTGVITRWNDPAVEADNPGIALPPTEVVPVVRADQDDSSSDLTKWLATEYPTLWNQYCAAAGRVASPCGETAAYPVVPGSQFISQSLSSGVVGYVAEPTSNGSITYSDTSYALEAQLPTVQLLNAAGYYTSPTAGADLVALTAARSIVGQVADLSAVYTNPDPRAYPLATVSYLAVPTATGDGFSTDKGLALGDFAAYALCQGQNEAALLGEAPLLPALQQEGLNTISEIPGAQNSVADTASCSAPFTADVNAVPQPPACDLIGNPYCGSGIPIGSPDGTENLSTELPPGELVISVPQNPNVILPSPVLDPSGQVFLASGSLSPITVTDNRSGDPGWTITGQISDFSDGDGHTIASQDLGWTPSVVSLGPAQAVVLGPTIAPTVGGGLGIAQTLATGTGLGTVNLGAQLALDVPTTTLPGTYSATLILTAM